MAKEKEWEKDEFDILLNNPELSDEELTWRLERTKGAIGVVRDFIHSYHRGGNTSGLSTKMMDWLKERSWTCPRCPWKKGGMNGNKR